MQGFCQVWLWPYHVEGKKIFISHDCYLCVQCEREIALSTSLAQADLSEWERNLYTSIDSEQLMVPSLIQVYYYSIPTKVCVCMCVPLGIII